MKKGGIRTSGQGTAVTNDSSHTTLIGSLLAGREREGRGAVRHARGVAVQGGAGDKGMDSGSKTEIMREVCSVTEDPGTIAGGVGGGREEGGRRGWGGRRDWGGDTRL